MQEMKIGKCFTKMMAILKGKRQTDKNDRNVIRVSIAQSVEVFVSVGLEDLG